MRFYNQVKVAPGGAAVDWTLNWSNYMGVAGCRLQSVELVEKLGAIPQADSGKIAVIIGGVGFTLKLGSLDRNGRILWNGDIPLNEDCQIQMRFIQPPANADCWCIYGIVSKDEPNWGNGYYTPSILETAVPGRPFVVSLASAAAATTLDIRPAMYETYHVLDLWAYHDDNAGAHNLNWRYIGVSTVNRTATSRAINVYEPLFDATHQQPYQLNYDNYLTIVADAMGAGKKLYIQGLVQKYGSLYYI